MKRLSFFDQNYSTPLQGLLEPKMTIHQKNGLPIQTENPAHNSGGNPCVEASYGAWVGVDGPGTRCVQ